MKLHNRPTLPTLLLITSFTALRQTHASSHHFIHCSPSNPRFSPSLHSLPPSNPRFSLSLHSLPPSNPRFFPSLHSLPPSNPRFFPSLHSLLPVKPMLLLVTSFTTPVEPVLLPFEPSHNSRSTFAACPSLFQDRRQRFTSYLQLLQQHPFYVPCISPKRT